MDENKEKTKELESTIPLDINKTPKQIYFELLRTWVQHAQMQQQLQAYFPYYLMNNYPQLFQSGNSTTGVTGSSPVSSVAPTAGAVVTAGTGNNQAQEEVTNRNGLAWYEYVIAPLWKRFVAEAIDVIIIFLVKVSFLMACVDFFDFDLWGIDVATIRNSLDEDYTLLLSLTSELIFLEVIVKIGVCIYETMWIWTFEIGQGFYQIGGATPGKMLMGIRILHAESVVLLGPPGGGAAGLALNNQAPLKALLYPATNVGLKRALCRSVAKNALLTLLFPTCLLMFFFKQNQSMYDIITKTIVVQENPAPVMRRR